MALVTPPRPHFSGYFSLNWCVHKPRDVYNYVQASGRHYNIDTAYHNIIMVSSINVCSLTLDCVSATAK